MVPPNHSASRRLVVAGGFGSGKSTAINLLMRSRICPVSVVARSRPVVHLHQTNARPEGLSPSDAPFSSDHVIHAALPALSGLLVTELQADRVEDVADTVLAHAEQADELIWCTIASQAWRQSERLTFDAIRKVHQGPAHLVVTRADLLRSPEDQEKIRLRLHREAADLFESIVFVGAPETILDQLADPDIWQGTGVARLSEALGIDGAEGEPPLLGSVRPVLLEPETSPDPIVLDEASTLVVEDITPSPEVEEVQPIWGADEIESGADTEGATLAAETAKFAPALTVAEQAPSLSPDAPPRDWLTDQVAAMDGFEGLAIFNIGSAEVLRGLSLSEPEMDELAVFSALLLAPHDDEAVEGAAILCKSRFVVIMPLPGAGNEGVAARFVAGAASYAATRIAMAAMMASESSR